MAGPVDPQWIRITSKNEINPAYFLINLANCPLLNTPTPSLVKIPGDTCTDILLIKPDSEPLFSIEHLYDRFLKTEGAESVARPGKFLVKLRNQANKSNNGIKFYYKDKSTTVEIGNVIVAKITIPHQLFDKANSVKQTHYMWFLLQQHFVIHHMFRDNVIMICDIISRHSGDQRYHRISNDGAIVSIKPCQVVEEGQPTLTVSKIA